MQRFQLLGKIRLLLCAVVALAIAIPAPAPAQSGLPLPPGQIITVPVYRGQQFPLCAGCSGTPGSLSGPITNGVDANIYTGIPAPTKPFVDLPSSPAFVVLTTVPTQYVRFYGPGGSAQGPWMVGTNAVRGLTPAQIKDVLALQNLPTMETIVQVAAGTCLLIGTAGPIAGWGNGGAVQEFLVGKSGGGPGCGPPPLGFAGTFINRQAIGAFALAYTPAAGGSNVGSVANALDHATPPPLYGDMDSVYNALDLLNFGDPAPLRSALAQLDGEIYADVPTVAIGVGQMFLDVLRDQTHLARAVIGPLGGGELRPWVSGLAGGGTLSGNGDSHGFGYAGGGVAAGVDHRFGSALQVGAAASYVHSAFSTSGIPGSGDLDSFAVGSYAGYAVGPWYFDAALGYSYNTAGVNRSIDFPGVARAASGNPIANAFLSRAEGGYHFRLNDRATATPFVSFQGIVVAQTGFAENGAGAIGLNVDSQTANLALGVLGAEFAYDVPIGLAVPLGFALRAGWAHDYADPTRGITANFQGAPDAGFTVNGARWPQDAAAVGARFSLSTRAVNLFMRYDGTLANGTSIHSATAGLLVIF